VDNLITDLHGWLLSVILARQIAEADGVDLKATEQWTKLQWIDDGKHDIDITLQPKP